MLYIGDVEIGLVTQKHAHVQVFIGSRTLEGEVESVIAIRIVDVRELNLISRKLTQLLNLVIRELNLSGTQAVADHGVDSHGLLPQHVNQFQKLDQQNYVVPEFKSFKIFQLFRCGEETRFNQTAIVVDAIVRRDAQGTEFPWAPPGSWIVEGTETRSSSPRNNSKRARRWSHERWRGRAAVVRKIARRVRAQTSASSLAGTPWRTLCHRWGRRCSQPRFHNRAGRRRTRCRSAGPRNMKPQRSRSLEPGRQAGEKLFEILVSLHSPWRGEFRTVKILIGTQVVREILCFSVAKSTYPNYGRPFFFLKKRKKKKVAYSTYRNLSR